MTKIPEPIHTTESAVDAAHEARQEPRRYHLGASIAGHYCDRYIWLTFRWAYKPNFPGRVLRLFRRGQREESTVVDDLRAIGCDVRNTGDNQSHVDLGSHVAGSIDGEIRSGLPGAAATEHVLEIKTHNKKSFDDVVKDGVLKSKPQHWAQMQLYMLATSKKRALYYAVCKDDDHIYTERVEFDADAAQKILTRAHRIATADRMPEPVAGAAQDWYQCKMCSAKDLCHGSRLTTEINCRTCAHSTAKPDGAWVCELYGSEISREHQEGCDAHVLHPDLVPWQMCDPKGAGEACYMIYGAEVRNGSPCANTYSSKEIIANTSGCSNPSDVVKMLRVGMDARLIEDDGRCPF